MTQPRISDRTVEQIIPVPGPRIPERSGYVQKRISDIVIEQIVDVLVPQIRDHIDEVMKSIPKECVRQHTDEQPVFGGNAEHIEKPIANCMSGNVEASKIHAGADADEPQEQQQQREAEGREGREGRDGGREG